MSAVPRQVDPAAAFGLLELAARQVRRVVDEQGYHVPLSLWLLADRLEEAVTRERVDALAVELAHQSAYRARRLELVEAFTRLNPGGSRPHEGCWPAGLKDEADRQAAAQRRELELCMGERFTRMLVPAAGGEAP